MLSRRHFQASRSAMRSGAQRLSRIRSASCSSLQFSAPWPRSYCDALNTIVPIYAQTATCFVLSLRSRYSFLLSDNSYRTPSPRRSPLSVHTMTSHSCSGSVLLARSSRFVFSNSHNAPVARSLLAWSARSFSLPLRILFLSGFSSLWSRSAYSLRR